ncbi:unnamed protein product [Cylicocyclus nassatus]|uniref:Amino acid transporter transmembrane domain-containing protein n=1 Tax=Cylicocyclus nassatus TaxID=53992 RepID=A0AA36H0C9_CYLNA|nr:unnamed protein product [Cylicocyclus nassatus]
MSNYGAIDDDFEPLLSSASPPPAPPSTSSRSSRPRQPYLFTGGLGLSREGSMTSLHSEDDFRQHNMALRYRLYNRLDPGGQQLRMPDHVIPSEYFSILPFDDMKDSSGKQSSLVTIFSLWNTMMGTSLLAMPWALQQAGLFWGIFLMLALALLCFYTAYRVLESPKGLSAGMDPLMMEFSDVCRHFLGKTGEYIAVGFSVIVILGGIMVYWVLMSNFLFYTGTVVYEALQPNSSTIPIMENKTFTCDVYCPSDVSLPPLLERYPTQPFTTNWFFPSWSFDQLWQLQRTVPIYLAFLTFPLMNFKSPTFFTKFNVLGTISVLYLLVFTGSKLAECGFNMNFVDPTSIHYAKPFNWRFPALTGTLTLSYFIHNAVITILRNQKNPENNTRDLSIGYSLAAFCYVFIGFAFYAGFPVQRSCISDNFLNNFGAGDIMSSTARMFLLFQMITVLPLLMFLIRSQLCYAFVGKTWPGLGSVFILNFAIMCMAVSVAIFYPKVGSLLRYVGAMSGLVYVFALPCIVYMKKLHSEGKLTRSKRIIHTTIIVLGVLNFIAQFVI